MGRGSQWQSWIHIEDLLRLIDRGVEDSAWTGAFNATAPVPVTQREFATTLAARFGRAFDLRMPDVALRFALGEMAQLLADGQRVLPFKARCQGFEFKHPTLERALESLYPRRTQVIPAQILYDPGCPICDMEMRRYCGAATRTGLHWRFADVAASPEVMDQCRIDSQTARRRMYLIDADGRMLSGIDALISIWAALPRWRWLARFVALPIVRPIANLLYDLAIAPAIWRWSTRRRARGLNRPALSGS